MKHAVNYNVLIRALCAGTYSQQDINAFVEECTLLAHPVIVKKIALGKINLDFLDVKEIDLVHDCIADLFERDVSGNFIHVRRFFEPIIAANESIVSEELKMHLRRLVVNTVQQNIINVYSDYDPVLAKILRSIKLAIEKSSLFELIPRFNSTYIVPKNTDPQWRRSPLSPEELQQQFLHRSALKDSMAQFLKKLYDILCNIEAYQRAIPVVTVGLFYKELQIIEWNSQFTEEETEHTFLHGDIHHVISMVSREMYRDARETYIATGKLENDTVQKYCNAVGAMLWDISRDGMKLPYSYFEYVQKEFPAMTNEEYMSEHRPFIEYLAKEAKRRFIQEMKNL